MRKTSILFLAILLAVVVSGCAAPTPGTATNPGPTSALTEQVKAGASIYRSQCASCHDPSLSGPVLDAKLLSTYKNAKVFFDYVSKTMPRSGLLKAEEYWNVSAYIFHNASKLPKDTVVSANNAETITFR
jgi:mono/diheme cytochrome c family protein